MMKNNRKKSKKKQEFSIFPTVSYSLLFCSLPSVTSSSSSLSLATIAVKIGFYSRSNSLTRNSLQQSFNDLKLKNRETILPHGIGALFWPSCCFRQMGEPPVLPGGNVSKSTIRPSAFFPQRCGFDVA